MCDRDKKAGRKQPPEGCQDAAGLDMEMEEAIARQGVQARSRDGKGFTQTRNSNRKAGVPVIVQW